MSEEDQGRGFVRINFWLDPRGQEVLDQLKRKYGSTKSGALRVGLEMIRPLLGMAPLVKQAEED